MSVLSGQNLELRRQVTKGEQDTRAMLQQLEKKQCEVSSIWETMELYKEHTVNGRHHLEPGYFRVALVSNKPSGIHGVTCCQQLK